MRVETEVYQGWGQFHFEPVNSGNKQKSD
uniref:Uncharacterized protein n=1 Tax=Anguilla anguilla TaxID=7936 RepID=A0A0E9Q0Z6_ANGAN